MFARSVSLRLKTNLLAELTRTIEDEMVPLLRKRTGFRGRITLGVPGGAEAVAISLWAKKWYAKAYNGEGPHAIQTYKVINSTFRPIAAPAAASSSIMGVR